MIDPRTVEFTTEFALRYEATPDKFVHCLDFLELSLVADGDEYCDKMVNILEDRIEARLRILRR